MKDSISHYQKKLRLSKSLVEIYETIPYDNKDQFMHALLKTLYEERMVNIVERNIKASRLPSIKTFDDFSYKILRSLRDLRPRSWNNWIL